MASFQRQAKRSKDTKLEIKDLVVYLKHFDVILGKRHRFPLAGGRLSPFLPLAY